MRKLMLTLALLILLLGFSGCGEKAVDESQIRQDVENYEAFSPLRVSISDFEIIKRQTDFDNKIDTVFVSVVGEHPSFSVVRNYVMEYVLYNDGWLLDGIEPYFNEENPDKTTPKYGVSRKQVISDLEEFDFKNLCSFENIHYISRENDQLKEEYLSINEEGLCCFEQKVKYRLHTFYEVVTVPIEYRFYGDDTVQGSWAWHLSINRSALKRDVELHEGILGHWVSDNQYYFTNRGETKITSFTETSCYAENFSLDYSWFKKPVSCELELDYHLDSDNEISSVSLKWVVPTSETSSWSKYYFSLRESNHIDVVGGMNSAGYWYKK